MGGPHSRARGRGGAPKKRAETRRTSEEGKGKEGKGRRKGAGGSLGWPAGLDGQSSPNRLAKKIGLVGGGGQPKHDDEELAGWLRLFLGAEFGGCCDGGCSAKRISESCQPGSGVGAAQYARGPQTDGLMDSVANLATDAATGRFFSRAPRQCQGLLIHWAELAWAGKQGLLLTGQYPSPSLSSSSSAAPTTEPAQFSSAQLATARSN